MPTITLGVALMVAGAIAGVYAFTRTSDKMQKKAYGLMGLLLVAGFVMSGNIIGYNPVVYTSGLTVSDSSGVAKSGAVTVTEAASQKKYAIGSLIVGTTEKSSGKTDQATGQIEIYGSGVDPDDPNANYIQKVNITSGTGTDTTGRVSTSTPYRIIYNGISAHYSIDFGETAFDANAYNPSTSELLYDFEVMKVGVFGDMLDESGNSSDVNGGNNGQEINVTAADNVAYSEARGDGSVYLYRTFECTGANTFCKDVVYCPGIWDSTSPPEGTELSSITAQLDSGKNLNIPNELVNYWKNEECVPLGTMKGGESSKYKLTYTLVESATDTSDIWREVIDDNGGNRAKDVGDEQGATRDTLTWGIIA